MSAKTVHQWEVSHALKSLEKDDHEKGCLPETYQEWPMPHIEGLHAPTLKELMAKVWANLPLTRDADAVEYDACEEPGRIDIQGMEDADANEATTEQLEKFKRGELPLFAVTYHFHVEYVTREVIALTEMPGSCPTCSSVLTPPSEERAGHWPPNYCLECDRQIDEEEVIRPWQG